MLKSSLVATAVVGFASAASAGSYTAPVVEAAPIAPVVTPVVADWSGAYIGGNVNYGEGKAKAKGALGNAASTAGIGKTIAKPDGANFALRGGYDWQVGQGVFGLGAEYNLGEYKSGLSGAYGQAYDANVKIKQAGTVFARAGYAFDSHWLAYGLLGYTWADGKVSAYGNHEKASLDGVTYGLGAAYKFDQNWSTYAEYTVTDFGTIEKTQGNVEGDLQQLKIGVDYRF